MNGARIAAKALHNLGVDTIFHIIGGPTSPIASEAHALGVRIIDVRHEEAAAMAAHAYSRLRGRPGVCLMPSGPATANAVPGVINALADACPVVAIGGSAALSQRGTGTFQEMDQVALMTPATKWAFQVTRVERIPEQFNAAFRKAMAGSKGPVYIDMPADVINGLAKEEAVAFPKADIHEARVAGDPVAVKLAIELLRKAQNPIVFTGSGVLWSEASEELRAFVDATGIPLYTTPQGRGVVPEDHALCPTAARSLAFREADVVLSVGTRANFIVAMFKPPRWRADMQLITVNLDPEEIDHNKETAVGIVADAKVALRQLTEVARGSLKPAAYESWVRRLQAKHAANEERVQTQMQSNATPIHPLRMMKEIRSVLQRDAVLVVDGHATLNFGRQSLPTYVAGHRINSGTHGTMGVGVPFALGAKAAKPDKQVVLVTGDGAFGWQGMNIDAACRQDLPFVTVINNNAGMGATAKGRGERSSGHGGYLGWSDYQMIAQAFGGYGERVEKPEEIRPALLRAIASGKCAVINVITDPHAQANTYSGFAGDVGDFH